MLLIMSCNFQVFIGLFWISYEIFIYMIAIPNILSILFMIYSPIFFISFNNIKV